MNGTGFGFATWKRLLGAAFVVLAAVTCGGDDKKAGGPAGPAAGRSGAGAGGDGSAGMGRGGRGGAGTGGESGSDPGAVAGEGGMDGQGGEGGAPSSLSGVVAGYLEGATAFLDLDEDFRRDSNEPAATTDALGRFVLELTGDIDPASFPVVALVPDSAIDSQTGERVPNAYVLAAPAGANTFVSPLSTLVVGLLGRFPSSSLGEAETSVRIKLAVSSAVSLFDDYVADAASSSATAGESQKLHRTARVLALSFGIDRRELEAITSATATPLDAFLMITHGAERELATVASAVAASDLDEDQLRTVAAFLKHVNATNLEERLDKSRRATRADLYDSFAGAGAHLPFPGPNGCVFGYARIRPTPADRTGFSLPQQDYVFDDETSTYAPEPAEFYGGYGLTADGWILGTAANATPTFASNADGSATMSSGDMRSTHRWMSNAVDLSGRLIRSYAKGIDVTDRDSRFPDGAIGYRLAIHVRTDEYDADEEDDYNPELYPLTTLDDVETTYGPDGIFLKSYSMLNLKLMGGGVVQLSSGRDDQSLPLAGSWRRKTVEGEELIEIDIPVTYKLEFGFLNATDDLIIAIIDGHARTGTVTRAGITDSEDYYFLNQTAMDAVIAAAVAYDDGTAVFGQVAADGYLGGATVFLDVNDNGLLDAGEPSDTTTPNGDYSLFWSERDFETHALGVLVPATATVRLPDDSQTFSVTQPFSLRAPPGETFITPYSTLAWYLLQAGTAATYEEAQATLSTTVGATGPLSDYVTAADAVQIKLRLVAGLVAEKLKQVRGRMLATSTGTATVAMNPDDIAIYQGIVGATHATLPATVLSVEMLLASAMAPMASTLDDYIDPGAWSGSAEDLFFAILAAVGDAVLEVVERVAAYVAAEIAGEILGDVPYVGWILGPSVECSIKRAHSIPCD